MSNELSDAAEFLAFKALVSSLMIELMHSGALNEGAVAALKERAVAMVRTSDGIVSAAAEREIEKLLGTSHSSHGH
jgi:hypothetical protein